MYDKLELQIEIETSVQLWTVLQKNIFPGYFYPL